MRRSGWFLAIFLVYALLVIVPALWQVPTASTQGYILYRIGLKQPDRNYFTYTATDPQGNWRSPTPRLGWDTVLEPNTMGVLIYLLGGAALLYILYRAIPQGLSDEAKGRLASGVRYILRGAAVIALAVGLYTYVSAPEPIDHIPTFMYQLCSLLEKGDVAETREYLTQHSYQRELRLADRELEELLGLYRGKDCRIMGSSISGPVVELTEAEQTFRIRAFFREDRAAPKRWYFSHFAR